MNVHPWMPNPLYRVALGYRINGSRFTGLLALDARNAGSANGGLFNIRQQVMSDAFPKAFRDNIELLDAMPGVGFLSAVTLIAEMGDFSMFKSAKAFAAFFGVDPTVKESGKFKGDRIQMSKRGVQLGRRVLFTIAVMHKLLHYIFAVLRNQKPFEIRKPEDHRLKHMGQLIETGCLVFSNNTFSRPLSGYFYGLALLYLLLYSDFC